MTTSLPVVVGVDGSASALDAVRLAAREAARRERELRIVHAFIWPLMHVKVGASAAVPKAGCATTQSGSSPTPGPRPKPPTTASRWSRSWSRARPRR